MKSFTEAYDSFDSARSEADVRKALENLASLNSFAGFYAIAELYKMGSNAIGRRVDPNPDKAAEFFIKAYDAFQRSGMSSAGDEKKEAKEFKITPDNPGDPASYRLQIKIRGADEIPYVSPEAINLEQINKLLAQAKQGHAEALFQLACVYREELKNVNDDGKRKIDGTKTELEKRMKGCLDAAAHLYHPHAAIMLLKEQKDGLLKGTLLTAAEKMQLGFIAADPESAKAFDPNKTSGITYRGDGEVRNPVVLSEPAKVTPEELFEKAQISGARMGGITQQAVTRRGPCILPAAAHKKYEPAQTLAAGAGDRLTPAQMREKRLQSLNRKA